MNKSQIINASVIALALLIGGVGVSSAYGGLGSGFEKPELTDDQKAVLDEMHDLRMEGNFEEANALRKEAGFPQMKGYRGQYQEHREEARTAVEANDYDAFLLAIAGSPKEETMTPEIFAKMVEMHALKEAGDYEGARAIMEELGIGNGKMMGGEGKRMGAGRGNCSR